MKNIKLYKSYKNEEEAEKLHELGGYDDMPTFAGHAGSYMGALSAELQKIAQSLMTMRDVSDSIMDDRLRNSVINFLNDLHNPFMKFQKEMEEADKRNRERLDRGYNRGTGKEFE